MTSSPTPAEPRASILETSPIMAICIVLVCIAIWIKFALGVPHLGAEGMMTDFDAFYIAGQFFWEGRMADAYDVAIMQARQSSVVGRDIFMPWTYPPTFDLFVILFPLAERGTSYALFTGLTLAFYVWAVWQVAGRYLAGVLLAVLPSLMMTVMNGQNGFLTGGLIATFALFTLRDQARAGVPLGLMALKPHLALALGLMVLARRQGRVLMLTLCTALLLSALAWLVFGTDVWRAFLASTGAAGENLAEGKYPLFRMTSVYAMLHRMNVPPQWAFAIQAFVAGSAGVAVVAMVLRSWPASHVLGLTIMLTLAISPYNYDYDMPILGVAFAVLAPELVRLASQRERLGLLCLSWIACGWGVFLVLFNINFGALPGFLRGSAPSIGAAGHLILILWIAYILGRANHFAKATSEDPRGAAALLR